MEQFINIEKGLKEKHLETMPLFEKVYTPPGYGNDMISRLYEDGSLYYLISSPDSSNNDLANSKWGYVSDIRSEGVEMIKTILEQCSEIDFKEKENGNLPGSVKWKFSGDKNIKMVEVKGIPEGDEKLFNEIDKLVSTQIEKV